jgi:hypothetical protein
MPDEDAFKAAVATLRREGKAPSYGNLRRALGHGSYRDIKALREKLVPHDEETTMATRTDADTPDPPVAVEERPPAAGFQVDNYPLETPEPIPMPPPTLLEQARQRRQYCQQQENAARQAWPQTDETRAALARWQQEGRKAQNHEDRLERSAGLLTRALPEARRLLRIAEGAVVDVELKARREIGQARRQALLAQEDVTRMENDLAGIAGASAVPREE